jgi:hypothetical protein
MRRAGSVIAMLAGVAFLVAVTALPVLELTQEFTYWDIETATPVILTSVGTLTLVLAVATMATESVLLPALVTGCGFYLFGKTFAVNDFGSGLGLGYWMSASASLAIAIGGLLATVGRVSPARAARC